MRLQIIVLALWLTLIAATAARAQETQSSTTAPASHGAKSPFHPSVPLSKVIRGELDACMTQLAGDGDFVKARQQLTAIFEQEIANDPLMDSSLLTDVEFNRRLVGQLARADESSRLDLLKFLRGNDQLARMLAFALMADPDAGDPRMATDTSEAQPLNLGHEDPAQVYAVLQELRQKRPGKAEKYPTLATAICIDYKQPFVHVANENQAKSNDAIAAFDYYTKYESHMLFGIRRVPAELLIWVVDTTTPPADLTWALDKYAGNRDVGNLFFTIKYDYAFFKNGTQKELTKQGFSLPNILKYGGVCIDQAYFATEVGKSIGVPTAVALAESGEAGHAWVGFLERTADGRTARWNFNKGRYAAYRAIRGNVKDPQTGQSIPDAYVSMTAELIGSNLMDRHAAVALTDAARHLMMLENGHATLTPGAFPAGQAISAEKRLAKPRLADSHSAEALVELGLRRFPGYVPGWQCVSYFAQSGKMSLVQKRGWSDILLKLCGNKYPDFTLAILKPMIQTIDDTVEQNKLWNTIFNMFMGRSDLQAQVRLCQADMWEKAGDATKAGICCEDIIARFANDGPFAIEALQRTETSLRATKRDNMVLTLYDSTWKRIPPPDSMYGPFKRESNWYKIGQMYAQQLDTASQSSMAKAVRAQLDGAVGAAGK